MWGHSVSVALCLIEEFKTNMREFGGGVLGWDVNAHYTRL